MREDLREVMLSRTRRSTAGYPYLHRAVWARLRDWVPLILDHGPRVLAVVDELEQELGEASSANARVVRQVVGTAAITAPSDLWLMRHVQSALVEVGLAERFCRDECVVASETGLDANALEIDLRFLLSRGTLVRQGAGYRLADHAPARGFMSMPKTEQTARQSEKWIAFFRGEGPAPERARPGEVATERGIWHPSPHEVVLGAELVPLVVAMRACKIERTEDPVASGILEDAGATERVMTRGPGPMGIIEAYRGYLEVLPKIWRGEGAVHVERKANVDASQDANAKSFKRANDALDRFCEDTGFSYSVFIEHAVGKGEAIRQRFARSASMTYIGADLEDAAIDAAIESGEMPPGTQFIRNADIGRPETLRQGLAALGVDPDGGVMMVGNGFHEARGKSDDDMVEVFRAYREMGLLLIFTEETALGIDDLLETAFNTYHAGFRYVHERSGQMLRPASVAPSTALEGARVMSWAECAERAGYRRLGEYCLNSRTVYPYTPPSGHNPSISVGHFLVPR